MKKRWLIDSDILIDFLRGLGPAVSFIKQASDEQTCLISAISVAELYAGVREGDERSLLIQFLDNFEIMSVSKDVAEKGGLYRRDYGKSHGVGLADALIAATTELHHAQLATLNQKHYPMLQTVCVPYKR